MAVLVNFFMNRSLGKLADFAEGEICRVLGVEKEIEKLKRTLARIGPHLQDADRVRLRNPAAETLVTELRHILYDIEDIIDDCMLDGGQPLKPHPSPPSSSSVVSLPFHLLSSCFVCTKNRHKIANRIEELNRRLKEISDHSKITSSLVQYSTRDSTQDYSVRRRETTPLEVKADIVGTQIEEAAEDLMTRILKDGEQKRCSVFGIVGMGGIGKTTLARKIMNDKRIKEKFPICSWLFVSKNYSETRLLGKIVTDAGGNDGGAQGIEELQIKVVSLLNKNFFIVLDDVWSIDVWNDLLRTPILNAADNNNGKILVSSRNEEVVRGMDACYTHHVKGMKEDDGWKLLCKIVFDEEEDSKGYGLDDIGMEIVKLCDRLPLAIKVTAGVLRLKEKTQREWEKVHESLRIDLWKINQIDADIPKALYLSYEDLPYDLKECFLICALCNGMTHYSIFRLWVAEGFIVEQGNTLMEEVAEDYYKQLRMRNLLQPDPWEFHNNEWYSMHDLLRRLATNLIREEAIILTNDDIPTINPLTKIRRLSLSRKGDILTLPRAITKQKCLRALQLHECSDIKTIEVGLFQGLQHLRILDICGTQIDILPGSLFDLVHLRYLDVDRTMIREIPEAVGRLTNLQTLNICECKSLCRLPDGITKLLNLRCLRLAESPLTHMPKGIGRLTNLNHVKGFVIGHDNDVSRSGGCGLIELQSFSKLRYLKISKLERAITTGTPVLANNTKFLRHLCVEWTKCEGQSDEAPFTEEEIEEAEKICDELMPPSAIEELSIRHFPGRRFPDWIMSTSSGITLRSLTYLKLWYCSSCRELPPLGRLPQLKCLLIAGAKTIKTIGREFLGFSSPAASTAFPKLELLKLLIMPNWEEWWLCEGEKGEDLKLLFPSLQECNLIYCPKLRAIPQNLYRATNLKNIFVTSSDEYAQRECSSNHSGSVLVHDLLKEPPDWTEFITEDAMEDGPGKMCYPRSW